MDSTITSVALTSRRDNPRKQQRARREESSLCLLPTPRLNVWVQAVGKKEEMKERR